MKKTIALILALALCLSFFGGSALAQEKKVFKVVNIGDSTSIGQALDDYGAFGRSGMNSCSSPYASYYNLGFMDDGSRDAYPAQLARYIQDKSPETDVRFTNLGVSGIRSVELLKLIDPETVGDPFCGSIVEQVTALWDMEYSARYDGLSLSEFMVREIRDADLITVDALMNCFTGVLERRFAVAFSADEAEREAFAEPGLHELADKLTPGAKKLLDSLSDKAEAILGEAALDNQVKTALDVVIYCYLDCCIRFSELIDKLREINPDARILVGGTYNPLPDLKLTYGGYTLYAGNLLSALLGLVDEYVVGYAPQRNEYSFINLPGNIETFREFMVRCGDMNSLPDALRSRMVGDMFGDGNYYSGNIIWAAICERSRELGGRTDSVGRTWLSADVVADMTELVQEQGEAADPFYRATAEVVGKYIDLTLDVLALDTFDAVEFAKAWTSDGIGIGNLLDMLDTPAEALEESAKAAIFCRGMMSIACAAGAHFSPEGCRTKFLCAVDVLENSPTPSESESAVRDEIKHGFTDGILGTLRAPMLDALYGVIRAAFNKLGQLFLSFAV